MSVATIFLHWIVVLGEGTDLGELRGWGDEGKALIATNYDESLQLLLPPWLVRRRRRISQGGSRNYCVCVCVFSMVLFTGLDHV